MSMEMILVDFGSGNLQSVYWALEHCGVHAKISSDPAEVADAPCLILPGVGAFGEGMRRLQETKLAETIKNYLKSGRPYLGICLGMQFLLESSTEFGNQEGFGLIPGKVKEIPVTTSDGRPHKVPHMGWSRLIKPEGKDWTGTMLEDLNKEDAMYFMHSFTALPAEHNFRLADARYNGRLISAALQSGAVCGCQFHPEKSGPAGLKVLRRFAAIANASQGVC